MEHHCHKCGEPAIASVRIRNTLRTYPFCEEHAIESVIEAERVDSVINKPCSKCGAEAPYYHHKPDCAWLSKRGP